MNDPVNVLLDDAQRKLVEAHYALLRLIPPHGTLEGALRAAERNREELLRLRARNDELERRLAAWVRGGEVPPQEGGAK